ncbi:hypothetical protein [Sessilibacter corallicola]|uniref:hypothetical protein n=1 Tax=Sessilibacter corallicola TaxID=2904075 RepID=UPI001E43DCB4|nr:hypothetical protein [Sessilibacter corallicola]MCE2029067.1 hypothetical protein [Sessilibacter corallicola]
MRKIFVFGVLCFFSLFSRADESVIGHWQTTQVFDGLPVVVDIVITQLALKDKSTKMSFASPRNCSVTFQYSGLVEEYEFFYVASTTLSTWCERNMRPGKRKVAYMKAKTNQSGQLIYDLFQNGARVEGGIAKRLK